MIRLILTLSLLYLSGCSTANLTIYKSFELSHQNQKEVSQQDSFEYNGLTFTSGQIVASQRNNAIHLLLTLMSSDFNSFMHVGIISIEDGSPYLYHATSAVGVSFTGEPPSSTMDQPVHRTPLIRFIDRQDVVSIYDPLPDTNRQQLVEFVQTAHQSKIPYDGFYDSVDRSSLYCSEFIVAAVEHAGAKKVELRTGNPNLSLIPFYGWLNVPSNQFYFVNDLVAHSDPIATISTSLTPDQIDIFFELRRELFARFTPTQKLGNLLRWTGAGVAYRPAIQDFMQRGLAYDFRPRKPNESLRQWIGALANQVFGPNSAS